LVLDARSWHDLWPVTGAASARRRRGFLLADGCDRRQLELSASRREGFRLQAALIVPSPIVLV
jgi:hypothetical protein